MEIMEKSTKIDGFNFEIEWSDKKINFSIWQSNVKIFLCNKESSKRCKGRSMNDDE